MPAPVLVVHNEFDTRELALVSLRAAGREAIGFENPMTALDAIEADSRVRVLVTGVDFGQASHAARNDRISALRRNRSMTLRLTR